MLTQSNKNKLTRSKQGFTIIEVMIVLAIAGLILLIVFLAVPALQRSSRNQQRKTDVGRIGSAATTVLSDNNNSLTGLTSATIQAEVGTSLSYYTVATDVTVVTAPAAWANATNINDVIVYEGTAAGGGAVCGTGANNGKVELGGATVPTTQLAIAYTDESGSGSTPECVTD